MGSTCSSVQPICSELILFPDKNNVLKEQYPSSQREDKNLSFISFLPNSGDQENIISQSTFLQTTQDIFCSCHPNMTCDFLLLNKEEIVHRICQQCIIQRGIFPRNYISINDLVNSKKNNIFQYYPPLKNKKLQDDLNSIEAKAQDTLNQIDSFFLEQKVKFEEALNHAQQIQRAKILNLIDYSLLIYNDIAQIDMLQAILREQTNSQDEKLHKFLTEKWNRVDSNEKIISKLFNYFQDTVASFSLKESTTITENLSNQIRSLDFFEKFKSIESLDISNLEDDLSTEYNSKSVSALNCLSLLEEIKMKSSALIHNSAQNLKITKSRKNILEVSHIGKESIYAQSYIDYLLKPDCQYVIQLEIEQSQENQNQQFHFGLIPYSYKDYADVATYDLANRESIDHIQLSKFFKGKVSNSKDNFKQMFKITICIKEKLLQVQSNTISQAVSFLNESKLNHSIPYVLAFRLYPGDSLKIFDFQNRTQNRNLLKKESFSSQNTLKL